MMLMPATLLSLRIATSVKQEYQREPGALRLFLGLMWYVFVFSKEKQKNVVLALVEASCVLTDVVTASCDK